MTMTDDIKFLDLKKVNAAHGSDIDRAIARTLDSGWYILGREDENFERAYADFIGTPHAVGCGNGYDALWLIFRALLETGRLNPGDEVAVPANTYIASILAISDNGLTPLLVEPDPLTSQISAEALASAVTPRTKALLIVHLYGRCAYNDKIADIVSSNGLLLLEDNAQAHGCRFGSQRTGSLGLAAAHSFYPGKNLGALGDAGAVTTSDSQLADTIRSLANYGSERKYVFRYRGHNSRLDELQAAVLSAKLPYLDDDNANRCRIAEIYHDTITHPDITLPAPWNKGENVFHIFPIHTPRRDELQKYLSDHGVQTLIHYPIPPHRQECYREWNGMSLPVTERLAETELSLPMSPVLTPEEAHRVADLINRF